MAVEYTLWMQRDGGETKDSLSDFGFAVCDIPWPAEETQDVTTREWPGEDGEDAYVPPTGLKLKAYDLEVEFCYKGDMNTAYPSYKALRNWLIGGMLKIYDPYWKKGRVGIYPKKIGDLEPHRDNTGEMLFCKATFRVTDPITEFGIESNVGD